MRKNYPKKERICKECGITFISENGVHFCTESNDGNCKKIYTRRRKLRSQRDNRKRRKDPNYKPQPPAPTIDPKFLVRGNISGAKVEYHF